MVGLDAGWNVPLEPAGNGILEPARVGVQVERVAVNKSASFFVCELEFIWKGEIIGGKFLDIFGRGKKSVLLHKWRN